MEDQKQEFKKEPEDIFNEVEKDHIVTSKEPMQNSIMGVTSSDIPSASIRSKAPIIIAGSVLLIVIVGLLIYIALFKPNMFGKSDNVEVTTATTTDSVVAPVAPTPQQPIATTTIVNPETIVEPVVVVIDSDSDKLSDVEEIQAGTDANKADTDNDGLFDHEEVKIYMTNPLSKDTDQDGFDDKAEIVGGYNPKGAGKLLGGPGQIPVEVPKQ